MKVSYLCYEPSVLPAIFHSPLSWTIDILKKVEAVGKMWVLLQEIHDLLFVGRYNGVLSQEFDVTNSDSIEQICQHYDKQKDETHKQTTTQLNRQVVVLPEVFITRAVEICMIFINRHNTTL